MRSLYEVEIRAPNALPYKIEVEGVSSCEARTIAARREGVSEDHVMVLFTVQKETSYSSDSSSPSSFSSSSQSSYSSYSPSADSGGCLIVVLGLIFASLFSFFNGEEVGEPQRIENSRPVPQPERVEDSRPTVESRRAEDSRLIFEPLADIYEDTPATIPSLDVIPDEPKPKESDCNMWARSGRRC